jgi:hypothetical protein
MHVDKRIKALQGSFQLFDTETVCEKLGITQDEKKQLQKEYYDQRRECTLEAIKLLHEAGMTVETISEIFSIRKAVINFALFGDVDPE